MRLPYLLTLLILLWSCSNENKGPEVPVPFKSAMPEEVVIGFYNVENLFDTKDDPRTDDQDFLPSGRHEWDKKRYDYKLERIGQVIGAMQTDLLGLAEIENREVLEDLLETMDGHRFAIAHEVGGDARGIECALLYDASLFELIDTELHSMSGNPDRGILEVGLEDSEGSIWRIFVNHWPSRRQGKEESEPRRLLAAQSLKQAMTDHGSEEIFIAVGDFNDEPEDASMRTLEGLENRSHRPDDGSGSLVHRNQWYLFDQILVEEDLSSEHPWRPDSFEIFKEDWILYHNRRANDHFPNRTLSGDRYFGGFSDHLPVMLSLERIEQNP